MLKKAEGRVKNEETGRKPPVTRMLHLQAKAVSPLRSAEVPPTPDNYFCPVSRARISFTAETSNWSFSRQEPSLRNEIGRRQIGDSHIVRTKITQIGAKIVE